MMVLQNLIPFALVWLAANILVFAVYARDKHQARRNGWRTSEARLLLLALLAPFGAYAAMLLFRHKTKKALFWLVPGFLCIQVVLAVYILYQS